MSRQRVADASDISEGEPHIVEVNGREIGLFRVNGSVYALPNRCPHQGAPLCRGTVEGTLIADENHELHYEYDNAVVFCPWHQLPIRVETGDCLSFDEMSLPTYRVDVEDGDVYVDLSQAGRA